MFCMSSDDALYFYKVFNENILNRIQYKERTQIYDCRISKGNNSTKLYGQELQFLCCARRLMMLYSSMKFEGFSSYRADTK